MISVVVPVYNAQKYLQECLDSLQNQTEKNFEIVLVDDGSSDISGEICDNFAKKMTNTLVLHTENQGLLLARRTGMLHCKGDYIACLDSDDCFRSDLIEHVQGIIEDYEADVICFDFSRGLHKTFNGALIKAGLGKSGFYDRADLEEVKEAVCLGKFNSMSNKVFRKEIIDLETDYSKYAGLMHGEDWLQIISIIDTIKNLYYLEEPLYFYRESPQSSTYSFKFSQLEDLSRVFEKLVSYSQNWGKSYMQLSHRGICMHCFWLIQNVAKGENWKEKSLVISKIQAIMERSCSGNIKEALAAIRLDFRVVLMLVLKNQPIMAMRIARIEDFLYKGFRKKDK